MKLDSIKYRLLLIILVCLFGMALLVGTQLYSTDRLINLSQQRMQLVLLHNQLLQLRRSEKDFMLRKRLAYVERQHRLLLEFQSAIDDAPQKDVLQGLLSGYQAGFEQLVHSYQQIGLRQDDGLKGEFRSIAQDMEMRLHQLDEVLKPLLNAEQQRVERTGLLIMLFTLATLMLVLIQSLVTFQRAFSAFIQFFYRCKRQYQRLDERKLGFAEFRSLAAVANEMVEARLAVEQELKAAKRELAKLNPSADNQ